MAPMTRPASPHLAKPGVPGYNTALTTKRAGTNRPFFLVAFFWSSKLSEKVSGGYRVFCFSGMEPK